MLFRAARPLWPEVENIFAVNQHMPADPHCPKAFGPHKLRDCLPRNPAKASRFRLRNPIFGLEIG
jgi:hypothetical protein